MQAIEICSPVRFDAGGDAIATFAQCVAYSGAVLKSSDGGLVIDVESLTLPDRAPLLFEGRPIGHFVGRVNEGQVRGCGFVYASGAGADVIAKARRAFPWALQLGIGRAHQAEDIAEGATVRVNGRLFAGPLTVWRACAVRAFSVTAVSIDERSRFAFSAGWPVGGQSTRFLAHPAGDLYLPI